MNAQHLEIITRALEAERRALKRGGRAWFAFSSIAQYALRAIKLTTGVSVALLLLVGGSGNSYGQSAQAYSRRLNRDLKTFAAQIKHSEKGKYFVRVETSDATGAIYIQPNAALWRRLTDAERIIIFKAWWQRWHTLRKRRGEAIELQTINVRQSVYCYGDNTEEPECRN
jgi:hypothetical protein